MTVFSFCVCFICRYHRVLMSPFYLHNLHYTNIFHICDLFFSLALLFHCSTCLSVCDLSLLYSFLYTPNSLTPCWSSHLFSSLCYLYPPAQRPAERLSKWEGTNKKGHFLGKRAPSKGNLKVKIYNCLDICIYP